MTEYIQGVLAHKQLVAKYMQLIAADLTKRAIVHDDSKFSPEESEAFERVTPLLKTLEYGSPEYKEALKELGPALEHHYKHNCHHPEYSESGINDMSLPDLIEMVCDWIAATQRIKDGNIYRSLEINKKRFHIDTQLGYILSNTIGDILITEDVEASMPDPNTLYPDVLLQQREE